MTARTTHSSSPRVEQIFGSTQLDCVSDELRKLTAMLAASCPNESIIKFEFDGKLRLHLDVRSFEELTAMERMLPTIGGGIFHDVQRGMSERHSFFHHLTAIVAR